MVLNEKLVKTVQLNGSYHKKPIDVYLFSPHQSTNTVTVICKGLFGVFDPQQECGINILGDMLIGNSVSHVVFYNSSRDFPLTADDNFEDREAAFSGKTFNDELIDLQTVMQYVIDSVQDEFNINQSELVLYLHGTSIGGTIALMITEKFPQIRKLSLCAPSLSSGHSKKLMISTMPESKKLLLVASQFTGDMFMIYGSNDTVVPKESSFAIISNATKAHTSSLVVPNADHSFRKLNGIETSDAHKVFAMAIFDFLNNINNKEY